MILRGDGPEVLICATNRGALVRAGIIAESTTRRTHNTLLETKHDVQAIILENGVNEQIESAMRQNEGAIEKGRRLGVALRAFGIALDIAANQPGMPENQEFIPYKTDLGKFLRVPRLQAKRGFNVSSSFEPRFDLGAHGTEVGDLRPRFAVSSFIGVSTVRRNPTDRKDVRNEASRSISALRYGGPLLRKPLTFRYLELDASLLVGEDLDPIHASEFPNLAMAKSGYWGRGDVELRRRRTTPVEDCLDDRVNEKIDASTASRQLDIFDDMLVGMSERPGTRLVDRIRDEIIES